MNSEETIAKGREVIKIEAEAVANLGKNIDENFVKAIELLNECRGRIVVTGMG